MEKKNICIILSLFIIILFIYIYNKNKNKIKKLNEEEIKNLKKGQLVMTDMLRVFDEICRTNNLKYWCTGGTLIGAIRHNGWIHHDADVDVGMLEKDYIILRNVIQKFLPKYYWFQDETTDSNYKCKLGKIRYLNAYYSDCKNKKSHNGLQLDIFVFSEKNNLLIPSHTDYESKDIDRNMIFPLKELNFENIKVFVPNKYCLYAINVWGGCPPPELPKEEQYPHEGRITFGAPKWMKDKYPKLYYK